MSCNKVSFDACGQISLAQPISYNILTKQPEFLILSLNALNTLWVMSGNLWMFLIPQTVVQFSTVIETVLPSETTLIS